MVDPDSDKVSRASPYSGTASRSLHHFAYGAFTLSDRLSQNRSAMLKIFHSAGYPHAALQPRRIDGLGSSDFARRYFRNLILISVPEVHEMVQFPQCGFRRLFYSAVGCWNLSQRVTPFGYPGISGYLLLPPAFRSLSRPSSPRDS